jgi:hypothetical protein
VKQKDEKEEEINYNLHEPGSYVIPLTIYFETARLPLGNLFTSHV